MLLTKRNITASQSVRGQERLLSDKVIAAAPLSPSVPLCFSLRLKNTLRSVLSLTTKENKTKPSPLLPPLAATLSPSFLSQPSRWKEPLVHASARRRLARALLLRSQSGSLHRRDEPGVAAAGDTAVLSRPLQGLAPAAPQEPFPSACGFSVAWSAHVLPLLWTRVSRLSRSSCDVPQKLVLPGKLIVSPPSLRQHPPSSLRPSSAKQKRASEPTLSGLLPSAPWNCHQSSVFCGLVIFFALS